MPALVWLQRELRIDFLPSLNKALAEHDEVIVCYFHDKSQMIGEANALWLGKALENLQQDYQEKGGQLWIAQGDFAQEFEEVLKQHDISHVYYSYQVGQVFAPNQNQVLEFCKEYKLHLVPFYSEDFFDPVETKTQKDSPYLVFTPYYKQCMKQIDEVDPFDKAPKELAKTATIKIPDSYQSIPQDLLDLQAKPWAKKMLQYWQVGEKAAWQKFHDFLDNHIADYDEDRDFPSLAATSELSPYLHFGHLTPVSLFFSVQSEIESSDIKQAQAEPWIRQLFWRNFARYLLAWFPQKEKQAFNEKYQDMDWDYNQDKLEAWQQGKTGIPIVDAAMRELWETGFMHNRVRMLVASLLTKNMNQDWCAGLSWFENTLFDADPANNSMGWQWVAGSGVDAAPYYRLFNPVVQSQKFDKHGEYIKKWLPELKSLSAKAVHEPWEHAKECEQKNIKLGKDYPKPIVDLKASRQAHLDRVEALKN